MCVRARALMCVSICVEGFARVCVSVCVWVCVWECVHVCLCMWEGFLLWLCAWVFMALFVNVSRYVCVSLRVSVSVWLWLSVYASFRLCVCEQQSEQPCAYPDILDWKQSVLKYNDGNFFSSVFFYNFRFCHITNNIKVNGNVGIGIYSIRPT